MSGAVGLDVLISGFYRFAASLGGEVNRGAWTYQDACIVLEEILQSAPQTASMDAVDRFELLEQLHIEVGRVATCGPVAAVQDIRHALAPLMEAKQPRAVLLVAAYRAADGRLTAREVETVATSEVAQFMNGMKAPKNVR